MLYNNCRLFNMSFETETVLVIIEKMTILLLLCFRVMIIYYSIY